MGTQNYKTIIKMSEESESLVFLRNYGRYTSILIHNVVNDNMKHDKVVKQITPHLFKPNHDQ